MPPETERIYRAVSGLDSERAAAVFGCSEVVAADARSMFCQMTLAGGYPAIEVYGGLAFRTPNGPEPVPGNRS